jgi:Bacterial regulatory proteins, gntR family
VRHSTTAIKGHVNEFGHGGLPVGVVPAVVAALAADYQAGHGTIRRALGRLQDEGLIATLPR